MSNLSFDDFAETEMTIWCHKYHGFLSNNQQEFTDCDSSFEDMAEHLGWKIIAGKVWCPTCLNTEAPHE